MSDPLSQLLRHADAHTPPPTLSFTSLPARVRQSAEKQFQRRVATGLLAAIPIMACLLLMAIRYRSHDQSEKPLAQIDASSSADLALQIAYHERVASLLEAHQHAAAPGPAATDKFLQQLQLERSKAALVLLSGAKDRLRSDPNNPQTVDRFRQTIALFPDTPAATIAEQEIRQIENSKRQS